MSAYVYVVNTGESIRDVAAPELRHTFAGSCLGRQGSDCADHVWSSNVIARDSGGMTYIFLPNKKISKISIFKICN